MSPRHPGASRKHDLSIAVGILAVCALAFGYFFIRTFVAPPAPQFDLDFGAARWIELTAPGAVVYFRQDVYLPERVEQAWIQVGATDSFELYVNGQIIATNEFDGANTSGVFDLKTQLRVGKNVVGVRVLRTTYPDPPRLIARLSTRAVGGPKREFFSDPTWRSAANTALVAPGMSWCSNGFDATAWGLARSCPDFAPRVDQVDLDPRVLATPPQGQWMTPPDAATRDQAFVIQFNSVDARCDAWLQVASPGGYEMFVNGTMRSLETSLVAAGKGNGTNVNTPPPGKPRLGGTSRPASTPVAGDPTSAGITPPTGSNLVRGGPNSDELVPLLKQSNSGMALQIYYVTPWLRKGANEIIIHTRAPRDVTALLADGFFILDNGETRRFTDEGKWRAVTGWAGGRPLATTPAVYAGDYGSPPWGLLPQTIATPLTVPQYDSETILRWLTGYLAIFAGVFGVAGLCSYFLSRSKAISFGAAFVSDALLHTPVICLSLLLWLLTFDCRLPANFAFRGEIIAGFIGLMLSLRALHCLHSPPVVHQARGPSRAFKASLLLVIVILGAAVRFHGLADMSLDHDEMTFILKSQGILQTGLPSSLIGSQLHILTTYELATYLLAATGVLLGWGEWAMRLPACLFGILNILLLAFAGRRMFDWRVGWFTALVFALMPVDIRWAQNVFYPSQAQFFATLTIFCFYEGIRKKPFSKNYLCAAASTFCLTYLSWEGTGFILPVLLLALIATRWGEYWWLREWALYRYVFWMFFVVFSQLCIRFLVHDPYLMVGVGLGAVSTPSLFFLDPNFDPYYYLIKLPFSESHVLLAITIGLGIFFGWRNRGIRYLFVVTVGFLACYTALLSAYSPRYCLFYQPLFILLGAAIIFCCWDAINAFAGRIGGVSLHRLNFASSAVFATTIWVSTNPWFIKAYRLSAEAKVPGLNARMNTYRVDYRGVSNYVKAYRQPQDAVFAGIPHVYEYYTGNKGGYFLDSLLALEIFYEPGASAPVYRDKFVGNPVVRNVSELRDVVNRAPRTWVIQAPLQVAQLNSPPVLTYLKNHGRLVYETYNANVILIEAAGNQSAPSPSDVE